MKKKSILLSLAVIPLLVACGGGGGSTTTAASTTTKTTKIIGTVPGTKIEAFCDNGKYYTTKSNNNGTNKHPFELDVKKDSSCTLVMTMNEDNPAQRTITILAFQDGSSNEVTRIQMTGDTVDLGYVDLPQDPEKMDDSNGDHVKDTPIVIEIPKGATETSTPDTTHDSNQNGTIDVYEDNNGDGTPNAYEDNNHNGTPDIQDDSDNDGTPDVMDPTNDSQNNGNTDGGDTTGGNTDNGGTTGGGNTGGGTTGNSNATAGQTLYANNCAGCHGTGNNSDVKGASLSKLRSVLQNGKGSMPAFPNVSADDVYAYFVSLNGGGSTGGNTGGGTTDGGTHDDDSDSDHGSSTHDDDHDGDNTTGDGTTGGNTGGGTTGNSNATAGQTLYANNCAGCHGTGNNSDVKGASLSKLRSVLQNGKGSMPAFPNVSADDVYAYFVSLNGGGSTGGNTGGGTTDGGTHDDDSDSDHGSSTHDDDHDGDNTTGDGTTGGNTGGGTTGNSNATAGQTLYANNCAGCHGTGNNSDVKGASLSKLRSVLQNGKGSMPAFPNVSADDVYAYFVSLNGGGSTGGNTGGGTTDGGTHDDDSDSDHGSSTHDDDHDGDNTTGDGTTGGNTGGGTTGNSNATAGQTLYANNCAGCHGTGNNSDVKGASLSKLRSVLQNGKGSMPAFPNVSADDVYAYFVSLNGGGSTGGNTGGGTTDGGTHDDDSDSDHGSSTHDDDDDHDDEGNTDTNTSTGGGTTGGGTTTSNGYMLTAWNDLGMHCMDGNDFSVFSVLPPFNNLHAQLKDKNGGLITSGVTLTYESTTGTDGQINTSSADKTNFWDFSNKLFPNSNLQSNVGLLGNKTPSTTPQGMTFDTQEKWWKAEGLPLTPYNDDGSKNYYPLVKVTAKDTAGNVLATANVVLPVSDEMDCKRCHASNSLAPKAKPTAGWVNNTDPEKDFKLNVLRLHDERMPNAVKDHMTELTSKGYTYDVAGLEASANAGTPILCAACHSSNALPGTGINGVPAFTNAIHGYHATVVDPYTNLAMNDSTNRDSCYACHPGSSTKCLRGAMGDAKDANGQNTMQCQSCHGNISHVGDAQRKGWLDEPNCQACHFDGKRENSAIDPATNTLRHVVDTRFATNLDTPASGISLYRFSTGHGDLQCEACHGATHAIYPAHNADNKLSEGIQGHTGTIAECASCHSSVPNTITGGPHGMHPAGSSWVKTHRDVAERNAAQCTACHGKDYRGSPLSKMFSTRTLDGKTFSKGQQVSCYACHGKKW